MPLTKATGEQVQFCSLNNLKCGVLIAMQCCGPHYIYSNCSPLHPEDDKVHEAAVDVPTELLANQTTDKNDEKYEHHIFISYNLLWVHNFVALKSLH